MESLVGGITPVVTEKNDFDYRNKSKELDISQNF